MPDSRAAMRGSMPEVANHRAFSRQRHRAANCDIRRNLPHFVVRSTRFVIRAEPHLIPPPFFDMGEDTGGGAVRSSSLSAQMPGHIAARAQSVEFLSVGRFGR